MAYVVPISMPRKITDVLASSCLFDFGFGLGCDRLPFFPEGEAATATLRDATELRDLFAEAVVVEAALGRLRLLAGALSGSTSPTASGVYKSRFSISSTSLAGDCDGD